MGTSIMTN